MTENKNKKTLRDYLTEKEIKERTKKCSKCKKVYLATPDYFPRRKNSKDEGRNQK